MLVVAAIAAVLHIIQARAGRHWRLLWLPVVDWVVMLATVVPVYHVACLAAEAGVWVLESIAACMELDSVHYVIFGISPALRCGPGQPYRLAPRCTLRRCLTCLCCTHHASCHAATWQ